jgi:Glyoxalase-like domain
MCRAPGGAHRLLFIEVDELEELHGRIHLDLVPNDRRRDNEVDCVLALGATAIADRRNCDGTGWMVLSRSCWHHFGVLRKDEEHTDRR